MADASYQQTSFLGGEWSKAMQGRTDDQRYRTAMNFCFNGFPLETGMWVRRPGSRYIQTTRGGVYARTIKFNFRDAQPYSMVFSVDGRVQFLANGLLAPTNDPVEISSISTATPAVVTIGSARTWVTGSLAFFTTLGATAPLLQNRIFLLTRLTSTTFELTDAVSGLAVNGSELNWSATPAALMYQVLEVVTPYDTRAKVDALKVVQSDDGAILMDGNQPQALQVVTQPTATSFADFAIGDYQFLDGPYLDPVDGELYSAAALTGTVTIGFNTNFLVSTDVGRSIRLYSEPPQWVSGSAIAANDIRAYRGLAYQCILAIAASNTPPPYDPSHFALIVDGTVWTWGVITNVINSSSCDVLIRGPDLLTTGQQHIYRLGLYSDTTSWPTCGTYSNGRIWLSGAVPNRIDSSIVGNVNIFSPTQTNGAVLDSSAISATFDGVDVNAILWMVQDQQGIICGTKGGEWLVQPSSSQAGLTPTNTSAVRVTKIGCANIEPARTEHTLVFVQKLGRKVIEFFADVASGKFTAPHLTYTGKHLTRTGIQEIAYQQELVPIVWCRVSNNLSGCTYRRNTLVTSDGPDAAGWHHHVLGSQREVVSMTVGSSFGGSVEALTMITVDQAGVHHIEVMTNIAEEGTAGYDAPYLDNSITPSSYSGAPVTDDMPYGGLVLNGLWHLNNKTITALMGGIDCGEFTVVNGSITVPFGNGFDGGAAQFTAEHMASFVNGMPMLVGFIYASQGQIVRPATPVESGARTGPALGKKRRSHQLVALLEGTQKISFGTDFDNLRPALFRHPGGREYGETEQFSGVFRMPLNDGHSYDSMLCWQITRPAIANIAALGALLQTTDA